MDASWIPGYARAGVGCHLTVLDDTLFTSIALTNSLLAS